MSNWAIRVDGLSKRYQIGQRVAYQSLREVLVETARRPWQQVRARLTGAAPTAAEEAVLWALHDLSFAVQQGEVLGIIGRNGAGKSTLLKVLSRITEPTRGRVELYGRVGSLLEVGTGFHPELTGRENVYLNGAILGMTRTEVERKFDEIIAFAEVEKFLDTPVKRYSSGMYTRLAFAVAAHLEPEILIVDEVLAVGDAAFQEKCLGKMGETARAGRTILFVSHNMAAVQSLCSRALCLHQGKIVEDGRPGQVISHYLQATLHNATERAWDEPASAPGNERVRLRRAAVQPSAGPTATEIDVRTPLRFEFEVWNLQPCNDLHLSIHLYNEQGTLVFDAGPVEPATEPTPVGLLRTTCEVPGDLLNDGMYWIDLLVLDDQTVLYQHDDLLVFDVQDSSDLRGGWYGKWEGVIRPLLQWHSEVVPDVTRSGAG